MLNPEFIQENETHNILWNFEIQMDHLILVRRADSVMIKKKKKREKKRTYRLADFAVPADHRVKIKESK